MEKIFLSVDADFQEQTDDGVIRFGGIAYSGGKVPDYGWLGDIAIDLSTATLAYDGKMAALFGHDTHEVVGAAKLSIVDSQIIVDSITVGTDTEAGRKIANARKAGYDWKLSIGVSTGRLVELSKKKKVEMNGQEMEIDAYIENAYISEVSFVYAGADPAAHAINMGLNSGGLTMSVDIDAIKADLTAKDNELAALKDELTATKAELSKAQEQIAGYKLEKMKALAIELGLAEEKAGLLDGLTDAQIELMRGNKKSSVTFSNGAELESAASEKTQSKFSQPQNAWMEILKKAEV